MAKSFDILQTDNSVDILEEMGYLAPRLFGGPLLYRDAVDPLINCGNQFIGRTTAQTLMTNPTIISMCPGRVQYTEWMKSGQGDKELSAMLNTIGSDDTNTGWDAFYNEYKDTFKGDKMFFKFGFDYSNYMNHVNLLARVMAVYMGIGGKPVPGNESYMYKNMDWRRWYVANTSLKNTTTDFSGSQYDDGSTTTEQAEKRGALNDLFSGIKNVFSYVGREMDNQLIADSSYIHFYANTSSSYSEDVNTSTRQSTIQSKIESAFDDTIKDVQFLAGGALGDDVSADIQEVFDGAGLSGQGWKSILGASKTYMSGGRMVFPQMVDDVEYGKSISISTRFVSNCGDSESIFLNCMLPLAHILAFGLPKQVGKNLYTYPFLVRLFSKGWMNCQMGVVTSMSIQRGGPNDSSWTATGVASEIEVSFTVTPLTSDLMVTSSENPFNFWNNDGLQEYLGTICGVNMKGDTIKLKYATMSALVSNSFIEKPKNVFDSVTNAVAGVIANITSMP